MRWRSDWTRNGRERQLRAMADARSWLHYSSPSCSEISTNGVTRAQASSTGCSTGFILREPTLVSRMRRTARSGCILH